MSGDVDQASILSIRVWNVVEVEFEHLTRLCSGRWLSFDLIGAAMELIDKPAWVRYDLSVPLDESSDGKVCAKANPFGLWSKKIENYRRKGEKNAELVFFCPLNIDTNHFTLLEINEQRKMIYHYDSMAAPNIISGKTRLTRVRIAVEVRFGDKLGSMR